MSYNLFKRIKITSQFTIKNGQRYSGINTIKLIIHNSKLITL